MQRSRFIQRLAEVTDEPVVAEIRLAEERSQIGFIESTAQDEYQVELVSIDWRAELWEGNVEFDKRVNLDDLDDPDKLAARGLPESMRPVAEERSRELNAAYDLIKSARRIV